MNTSQAVEEFSRGEALESATCSPSVSTLKRRQSHNWLHPFDFSPENSEETDKDIILSPRKQRRPHRRTPLKQTRYTVMEILKGQVTQKQSTRPRQHRRAPVSELTLIPDRAMPTEDDEEDGKSMLYKISL